MLDIVSVVHFQDLFEAMAHMVTTQLCTDIVLWESLQPRLSVLGHKRH